MVLCLSGIVNDHVTKELREFYRALALKVRIDVVALLLFIISFHCTINIFNIPSSYFIHNSKISYIFINKMIDLTIEFI